MTVLSTISKSGHLRLAYIYGGTVTYQPEETLGPRVLSDWELVLIYEGQVIYRADGHEFAAPPGSVILARPGFEESYRWDPRAPTRHAYFHFNIETIPDDWPEPDGWPIVREKPDPAAAALFEHVLHRIVQHSNWPFAAPNREDCRVVETLLSLIITDRTEIGQSRESTRPEAVNRAIKWMRELIDETPLRPVTLVQLAKRAGVSPKHLCRLFQDHLGHSPMRTLRLLRLQLAMTLIARSNLPMQKIAKRCGFDDPLYFSRCFANTYGKSPSQARKACKEGLLQPGNPLPVDITPRVYW